MSIDAAGFRSPVRPTTVATTPPPGPTTAALSGAPASTAKDLGARALPPRLANHALSTSYLPSLPTGRTSGLQTILQARTAGPTQTDMNIQAGKGLRAAEVELAAAESQEKLGRTGPLRQLQEAEEARFDAYAEHVGAFAASAFQGGSLAPFARSDAMTGLVQQRTARVMGRNVEGVVAPGSTAGAGLDTQTAMNQDAGHTLRGAQAQLASVTEQVRLRLADSPRAALFEASCKAFDAYAHAASATAGERVKGGSLEPLARAGATESLVRERTALLEKTLAALSL
jgi:hypothetical protein